MAALVFTNAKILVAQYDLSGDSNKVTLKYGAELKDVTAFGATTRKRSPGLELIDMSLDAFWNSEAAIAAVSPAGIDTALDGILGTSDKVVTVAPTGGAVSDVAYFFQSVLGQLDRGGQVGDPLMVGGALGSRGTPLCRGLIMATGAKTATGSGTDIALSADVSGRFLALVNMKATTYTLTNTTFPSGVPAQRLSITHATLTAYPADVDTLGSVLLTGTDENGNVIQESVALVHDATVYTSRKFATLTAAITSSWVIDAAAGVADKIKIGYDTRRLYAAVHCLEPFVGGGTLVVKIQSSPDGSSWNDVITFTGLTAGGSQYATPVAGPFTDTHWRATWALTGGSGYSAPITVVAAIQ